MADDREDDERERVRAAAITALVGKYTEILGNWALADRDANDARQLLLDAEQRKAAAREKIQECYRAATLFEFDLDAQWDIHASLQRQLFAEKKPIPTPQEALRVEDNVPLPKTIREHAIEAAQQAFPNPIRAAAVRAMLDSMGIKTHEKTVGMTLYRLLREGSAGATVGTGFIPELERPAAATGDEESPADTGLLLAAE